MAELVERLRELIKDLIKELETLSWESGKERGQEWAFCLQEGCRGVTEKCVRSGPRGQNWDSKPHRACCIYQLCPIGCQEVNREKGESGSI